MYGRGSSAGRASAGGPTATSGRLVAAASAGAGAAAAPDPPWLLVGPDRKKLSEANFEGDHPLTTSVGKTILDARAGGWAVGRSHAGPLGPCNMVAAAAAGRMPSCCSVKGPGWCRAAAGAAVPLAAGSFGNVNANVPGAACGHGRAHSSSQRMHHRAKTAGGGGLQPRGNACQIVANPPQAAWQLRRPHPAM